MPDPIVTARMRGRMAYIHRPSRCQPGIGQRWTLTFDNLRLQGTDL